MEPSAALWLLFIKKAHLGCTHTHSYWFPFKVQIVLYVTLFIFFPLLKLHSLMCTQTNTKCNHLSLVSKPKNSSEVSRDSCRPFHLGAGQVMWLTPPRWASAHSTVTRAKTKAHIDLWAEKNRSWEIFMGKNGKWRQHKCGKKDEKCV